MRMVQHDAAAVYADELLLGHGGNPVARWNADSAEVRRDDQDRIKLVKPDRAKTSKRVDGLAALANALKVELDHIDEKPGTVNLW
jgi:phage terminase large subunit-like protein